MDPRRAEENLELIRTLMERSSRYEHLSTRGGARVGLVALAGCAVGGWSTPQGPAAFVLLWGVVLVVSLIVVVREHLEQVRAAGAEVFSRPAIQIVWALAPALFVAAILTVHAVRLGRHLELPGLWMLCYGCGALATKPWAPRAVPTLGIGFLGLGSLTLWLGPTLANPMMGAAFGGGHLLLAWMLRDSTPVSLRVIRGAVG